MSKKLKLAIVGALAALGVAVGGYFVVGPGSDGGGYDGDRGGYSDTYGGY